MFKNPLVIASLVWVYVISIFLFASLFGFYAGMALFFAGAAALLAFVVMNIIPKAFEPKEENQ